MRRVALVLLLVGVLAATGLGSALWLLRGGSDFDEAAAPRVPGRPPSAPDPTAQIPPEPALERFYAQRLRWESCREDFECAQVEVPLDYADPAGETIRLLLLRDPADVPEQRIGSLVVNPGGPGAPGTQLAEQAKLVFGRDLRASFDIVGFDPRGTGASAPVDCVSDAELDESLAQAPVPETAEDEAVLAAADRDFLAGCMERSGALAGHISTVETARDLDVIRAALGEAGLSYFGASYGTKLGATYADLFPDRARWLVLDGAIDPTLHPRQQALQQAAGFETALTAYVESCVADSGCFLGETAAQGLQRIKDFLTEVEATPLQTSGDRELKAGNAFYGLITPLYDRAAWPMLSTALRTAFGGDGTLLMMLADLYASRSPDGTYEDNSVEALVAINCLDDPWSIEPEQVEDELPAFLEASPTFGAVFAWGLTGCAGYQAAAAPPSLEYRAAGAAPILVIGTTRDPATPLAWAEALAARLESGILIRRDGDGHTGYRKGNRCVDDAVEDFLLDGVAPSADLDC